MELGLLQGEVAQKVGVTLWTVINWERQRTTPGARMIPAIVRFLGYDPLPKGGTFPERLRVGRLRLGLTQDELAERLGLDGGTIRDAEASKRRLHGRVVARLLAFITETSTST
jgi:transcriptional regulator with XRE-family HTH domain